jgi:hypothetical protein
VHDAKTFFALYLSPAQVFIPASLPLPRDLTASCFSSVALGASWPKRPGLFTVLSSASACNQLSSAFPSGQPFCLNEICAFGDLELCIEVHDISPESTIGCRSRLAMNSQTESQDRRNLADSFSKSAVSNAGKW